MKNKRTLLIALAALLFGVAAWMSRCADEAEAPAAAAGADKADQEVVYPRQTGDGRALPPRPSPVPEGVKTRPAAKDPILDAMAGPGGGAVFVEVNAIRHSDLVETLLRCREADLARGLDVVKDDLGIDPLEDVDRVAVQDEVLGISGFFDELKVPDSFGEPEAYGDDTDIFRMPVPDGGLPDGAPTHFARVGDGLLLLGDDEASLHAAVDRAEGRAPTEGRVPDHLTSSEIYGRFGSELLQGLLASGAARDPLVARVQEIVTAGNVRVLVDDHVSMSLDLETRDTAEGEDLAKALGGALSVARQRAKSDGQDELAELLSQARVLPEPDGRFGVDVAVPGDLLLRLAGCAEDAPAPSNDGATE
jgi:hypothetical protein